MLLSMTMKVSKACVFMHSSLLQPFLSRMIYIFSSTVALISFELGEYRYHEGDGSGLLLFVEIVNAISLEVAVFIEVNAVIDSSSNATIGIRICFSDLYV